MRIYNTLTREVDDLRPLSPGRVGMYVCGPTTQSEPHLGHARQAVVFDVLYRFLRAEGFDVVHVANVTDVEDKIIARAAEEGRIRSPSRGTTPASSSTRTNASPCSRPRTVRSPPSTSAT